MDFDFSDPTQQQPQQNPQPQAGQLDPTKEYSLDDFEEHVRKQLQIPKNLTLAIKGQESNGGNTNAVSKTGVRGAWQLTTDTAKSMGLDRNDPFQQAAGAMKYLRDQYDSSADIKDPAARWMAAVGKYYGGPDAVKGTVVSTRSRDGVSNPVEHIKRVAAKWKALGLDTDGDHIPDAIDPQVQSPAGADQKEKPAEPEYIEQAPVAQQKANEKIAPEDLGTGLPDKENPIPATGSKPNFIRGIQDQQLSAAPDPRNPDNVQRYGVQLTDREAQGFLTANPESRARLVLQHVIATFPQDKQQAAVNVLTRVRQSDPAFFDQSVNDIASGGLRDLTNSMAMRKPGSQFEYTLKIEPAIPRLVDAYQQGGYGLMEQTLQQIKQERAQYVQEQQVAEQQRQQAAAEREDAYRTGKAGQGILEFASRFLSNNADPHLLDGSKWAAAFANSMASGAETGLHDLAGGAAEIGGMIAGRAGLDSVDRAGEAQAKESYAKTEGVDKGEQAFAQASGEGDFARVVAKNVGALPQMLLEATAGGPYGLATATLLKNARQEAPKALLNAILAGVAGSGLGEADGALGMISKFTQTVKKEALVNTLMTMNDVREAAMELKRISGDPNATPQQKEAAQRALKLAVYGGLANTMIAVGMAGLHKAFPKPEDQATFDSLTNQPNSITPAGGIPFKRPEGMGPLYDINSTPEERAAQEADLKRRQALAEEVAPGKAPNWEAQDTGRTVEQQATEDFQRTGLELQKAQQAAQANPGDPAAQQALNEATAKHEQAKQILTNASRRLETPTEAPQGVPAAEPSPTPAPTAESLTAPAPQAAPGSLKANVGQFIANKGEDVPAVTQNETRVGQTATPAPAAQNVPAGDPNSSVAQFDKMLRQWEADPNFRTEKNQQALGKLANQIEQQYGKKGPDGKPVENIQQILQRHRSGEQLLPTTSGNAGVDALLSQMGGGRGLQSTTSPEGAKGAAPDNGQTTTSGEAVQGEAKQPAVRPLESAPLRGSGPVPTPEEQAIREAARQREQKAEAERVATEERKAQARQDLEGMTDEQRNAVIPLGANRGAEEGQGQEAPRPLPDNPDRQQGRAERKGLFNPDQESGKPQEHPQDFYRRNGIEVNDKTAEEIRRRREQAGDPEKGIMGKLGQFARRALYGKNEDNPYLSLVEHPVIRRILGLPQMVEYRGADGKTTDWGTAAQHTMDALAEIMGFPRSSHITDETFNPIIDFFASKTNDQDVKDLILRTIVATDLNNGRADDLFAQPNVMDQLATAQRHYDNTGKVPKKVMQAVGNALYAAAQEVNKKPGVEGGLKERKDLTKITTGSKEGKIAPGSSLGLFIEDIRNGRLSENPESWLGRQYREIVERGAGRENDAAAPEPVVGREEAVASPAEQEQSQTGRGVEPAAVERSDGSQFEDVAAPEPVMGGEKAPESPTEPEDHKTYGFEDYRQQLEQKRQTYFPDAPQKEPVEKGTGTSAKDPAGWRAFIEKIGQDALDRLNERAENGKKLGGEAGEAPMLLDLADYALYGASRLASHAFNFAEFTADMLRKYGAKIRPHLREIYDRAKAVNKYNDPELANVAVGRTTLRETDDLKSRTLEETRDRIKTAKVVSKDPSKQPDGRSWLETDPEKPGEGFLPFQKYGAKKTDAALKKAMDKSAMLSGLPQALRDKIQIPAAEWWNRAFSLADGARYWYERSGAAFGDNIKLSPDELNRFIDTVAATSGGEKPYRNLRNAIASFSQFLREDPVTVGVRDAKSLEGALSEGDLSTHKFGSFSGTLALMAGLRDGIPLPTIDLQMSNIFKLNHGKDVASDPRMYETLARFMIEMRDMQNAELPEGANPYESWQTQALAWVLGRGTADPDDYAARMPDVVQVLKDAGIPLGKNGEITHETMMDPRTAEVMAPTSKLAAGARVGTMEARPGKIDEHGQRVADLRSQLEADEANPKSRKLLEEHDKIEAATLRAMTSHTNQDSPIDEMASAMYGKSLKQLRPDSRGMGTYDGQVSQNMRLPMIFDAGSGKKVDMSPLATDTPEQAKYKTAFREALLSMIGQDMNQEAAAGSSFLSVDPETHASLPPEKQGWSIRISTDQPMDAELLKAFNGALGDGVNYSKVPNGHILDILPLSGKVHTEDSLREAAEKVLPEDAKYGIIQRSFDSDYIDRSEYDSKIKEFTDGYLRRNPFLGSAKERGNPSEQLRNLKSARKRTQSIVKAQRAAEADWAERAADHLEQSKGKSRGLEADAPAERPESAENPGPRPGEAPTPDSVESPSEPAFVAEARARNRKRLSQSNSGVDPAALRDLAITTGYDVYKGVKRFADWASELIAQHGEAIRPYLRETFDKIRENIHKADRQANQERADYNFNKKISSPAFKEWSGDAPVVRGKDALNHDFQTGQPVVVEAFHGTNAESEPNSGKGEDFTFFDQEQGGSLTAADSARQGVFSSSDPMVAENYASNIGMGRFLGYALGGSDARLKGKGVPGYDEASNAVTATKDAYAKAYRDLNDAIDSELLKKYEEAFSKDPEWFGKLDDAAKKKMFDALINSERIAMGHDEMDKFAQENFPELYEKQKAAEKAYNDAGKNVNSIVFDHEASKMPQRIMPLMVRMKNPFVYDAEGKRNSEFPLNDILQQAKENGHDGVILKNVSDGETPSNHYVSFDSKDIKSQFNKGTYDSSMNISHDFGSAVGEAGKWAAGIAKKAVNSTKASKGKSAEVPEPEPEKKELGKRPDGTVIAGSLKDVIKRAANVIDFDKDPNTWFNSRFEHGKKLLTPTSRKALAEAMGAAVGQEGSIDIAKAKADIDTLENSGKMDKAQAQTSRALLGVIELGQKVLDEGHKPDFYEKAAMLSAFRKVDRGSTKFEKLGSFMMANLLSGAATIMRPGISSSALSGVELGTRALAVPFDMALALGNGGQRTIAKVSWNELQAAAAGLSAGTKDMVRGIKNGGVSQLDFTSHGALVTYPQVEGLIGKYANPVGDIHKMVHSPAYMMARSAALMNQAKLVLSRLPKADRTEENLKYLVENPTGEMIAVAEKAGQSATLYEESPVVKFWNNAVNGALTSDSLGVKAVGHAMKWVAPFGRVGLNAAKKLAQYHGVSLMGDLYRNTKDSSKEWRGLTKVAWNDMNRDAQVEFYKKALPDEAANFDGLSKTGQDQVLRKIPFRLSEERQRETAMNAARASVGVMLMAGGMLMRANGLISHEDMDNENRGEVNLEQESGHKLGGINYSIFGNKRLNTTASYLLHPISIPLFSGARIYDAFVADRPHKDPLLERTLQTMKEIGFDAIKETPFGILLKDLNKAKDKGLTALGAEMVAPSRMIPGPIRDASYLTSGGKEKDTYDKDPVTSLGKKYLAAMPFANMTLDNRTTVGGDEVPRPFPLDPSKTTMAKPETPVLAVARELGVRLSMPKQAPEESREDFIKRRKEQVDQWQERADGLINDPEFKTMSAKDRKDALQKLLKESRDDVNKQELGRKRNRRERTIANYY